MRKKDVLKYYGGVQSTATALGLTKQAVSLWKDILPECAALKVAYYTRGDIPLRPEDYGLDPGELRW